MSQSPPPFPPPSGPPGSGAQPPSFPPPQGQPGQAAPQGQQSPPPAWPPGISPPPSTGQPSFGAPPSPPPPPSTGQPPLGATPPPPPGKRGLKLGLILGGTTVIAAAVVVTLVLTLGGGAGTATTEEPGSKGLDDLPKLKQNDSSIAVAAADPLDLMPSAGALDGNEVIQALYAGLVRTDPASGTPVNRLAESITSPDATKWTVKLKPGHTFHNGDKVTAESFVDAWSLLVREEIVSSLPLASVKGYRDVRSSESGNLSGLKVVSDSEFTVELKEPNSGFPALLADAAFYPLAKECVDDPKKCKYEPIGNGPFKLDGSFEFGQGELSLTRVEDYPDGEAQYKTIDFTLFDSEKYAKGAAEAFTDGSVDVAPLADDADNPAPKQDFKLNAPSSDLTYLEFPDTAPFDKPEIRKAISLSIDREAVIAELGTGNHSAAKNFLSPVLTGESGPTCGNCETDVDKAKKLFDKGGWKSGDKLELPFAEDATNVGKAYSEAVCASFTKKVGIDCAVTEMDAEEYLEKAGSLALPGPTLSHWNIDPSNASTFLTFAYGTAEAAPEKVTKAVEAGNKAEDVESALKEYGAAEAILDEDMPLVPLSFGARPVGLNDRVLDDSAVIDLVTETLQMDLLQVKPE